jgi:hypothetical protein
MAAVKIKPPRDPRCRAYRDHLRDRVDQRQFLAPMAIELDEWLRTNPEAPDLAAAPQGWHKSFDSFTICGEGECIKTLFTIYAPGKPRQGSVDLDVWKKRSAN